MRCGGSALLLYAIVVCSVIAVGWQPIPSSTATWAAWKACTFSSFSTNITISGLSYNPLAPSAALPSGSYWQLTTNGHLILNDFNGAVTMEILLCEDFSATLRYYNVSSCANCSLPGCSRNNTQCTVVSVYVLASQYQYVTAQVEFWDNGGIVIRYLNFVGVGGNASSLTFFSRCTKSFYPTAGLSYYFPPNNVRHAYGAAAENSVYSPYCWEYMATDDAVCGSTLWAGVKPCLGNQSCTFDFTADFTTLNGNPNGRFVYGAIPSYPPIDGRVMLLDTTYSNSYWYSSFFHSVPSVSGTVVHPGCDAFPSSGVIGWRAFERRHFTLSVSFTMGDTGTTEGSVYLNTTLLYRTVVTYTTQTFTTSGHVEPGWMLWVVADRNGSCLYDSTNVSATIRLHSTETLSSSIHSTESLSSDAFSVSTVASQSAGTSHSRTSSEAPSLLPSPESYSLLTSSLSSTVRFTASITSTSATQLWPSPTGTYSTTISRSTSPMVAAWSRSATLPVAHTVSLTSALCAAPPSNSSLHVVEASNNESVCRDHVCPTSHNDADGKVALTVAYDAMVAAQSLLLLLADDGVSGEWLSLLPSVRFGMVMLDTVAVAGAPNHTVGVVVLRPGSGWPGLEVRPYALQRLSIVVSLRCLSANGTVMVVPHPGEMMLLVTPRSMPVAASVQAVVQSSQAIVGGLGGGGGTEALTMGRLATSMSMLSCDNVLEGYGAGLGVVSVSGELLAAVDTIAGNVVFVSGVAVAAVLSAGGLYLYALSLSSSFSLVACCHDVLRLPLSLFPVFAATLPSTVMAVVAVLRDAPTLSGRVASGAYSSIGVATALWGGALVLVGAATRRMAQLGTQRLVDADAFVSTVRWAFHSSTEWVSPRPADLSLFEGTTVLWLLPLDVSLTVAMAAVSALPLSRSHALCVGANAVNVGGCAAMLAVAALRRPFSTPFGRIHSVVTSSLVFALALCGLVLVAGSTQDVTRLLLLAASYLSGSVAVISALKAAVDVANIVSATRDRFLTLTPRPAAESIARCEMDDLVVVDRSDTPATADDAEEEDDEDEEELLVDCCLAPAASEHETLLSLNQDESEAIVDPLGDLLSAYQHSGGNNDLLCC